MEEIDFIQPKKTICKLISIDVIDKIRAEIMQLDYDLEYIDYDYDDMAQTDEVHMICREMVLQIIDKYKAESEVEDEQI